MSTTFLSLNRNDYNPLPIRVVVAALAKCPTVIWEVLQTGHRLRAPNNNTAWLEFNDENEVTGFTVFGDNDSLPFVDFFETITELQVEV